MVQDSRGKRLKTPMSIVADGRADTTDEALKLGLIDQKGFAPEAYAYAATKAGIPSGKMPRGAIQARAWVLRCADRFEIHRSVGRQITGHVDQRCERERGSQITRRDPSSALAVSFARGVKLPKNTAEFTAEARSTQRRQSDILYSPRPLRLCGESLFWFFATFR